MKQVVLGLCLPAALLTFMACPDARAQFGMGNTIYFSNRDPGHGINAPFYDADGITRLDGPSFRAALVFGPDGATEDQMVQLGAAQPFQSGFLAGYWQPSTRTVPVPTFESRIIVQVRFWDSQNGALTSFEQAYAAGAKVGFSDMLHLTLSQTETTYLIGLRSVSLIRVLSLLTIGETRAVFDAMAVPNGLQLGSLCSKPVGRMRWFNLTFANAGEAVINTDGSSIDTVLSVYTSCLLNSNACAPVACNDDRTAGQTASEVRFRAQTNMTYAVAVGGVNGATGALQLTFSMPVTLAARPTSDKRVEISWPVEATNVTLQATSGSAGVPSAPPFTWSPVTTTPSVEGNRNVIRVLPSGTYSFYRLKRNSPP